MKKILVVSALFLIFLIGCSNNNDQQNEDNQALEPGTEITPDENQAEAENEAENKTDEESSAQENFDTDPLPTTIEELVELEIGKYGGELYNRKDGAKIEGEALLKELGDDLPELSDHPSDDELDYFYRETLKLVQDDYEGEEEILKDLKFQLMGDPGIEDPRYQFKEQLNVEILLDASGSMAEVINGKSKMDIAKDTITSFLGDLPKETNVALRVYGHKGSGSSDDKELSCSESDILYGFKSYDKDKFASALNEVQPVGWTPNGLALKKAQEDMSKFDGKENTNIVYMVSDGMETCDSEPVKVAKEFYDSNIQPIVNIIGFDVDSEGQNHLKEIANAAEGIYQSADDQDELAKEFDKINELAEAWEAWKKKGSEKLDRKQLRNDLDIFVHITKNITKLWDEETALENIYKALLETEEVSEDTFNDLNERNKTYHKDMREKMDEFKKNLEEWNENSYEKALKKLDEKYDANKESE